MARSLLAGLGSALLSLPAVACADGGSDAPPPPPVKQGADVSEATRHDSSPPLRDIPPAKHQPGQRVHTVKPIPRPKPPPPKPDEPPGG